MNRLKQLTLLFSLLMGLGHALAQSSKNPNFAISEEKLIQISENPQWRMLLHFPRFKSGSDVSSIDSGDFFLSSEGRTNPLAELKATLKSVDQDLKLGPLKQHPLCVFQARTYFLKTNYGIEFPKKDCADWNGFLTRFNGPKSVHVIFSSAYSSNPASMFGHLFLRIGSSSANELLDQGINYAAQVPEDEHPLAFFYFGVFGGYHGRWSTQPYYEKLNEYVKAESRDLWDYELNLTKDEVIFLLGHLWELETTSFTDYYFFDENCAYQIMKVIEAIKPDWRLTGHKIYAIPGEMIKNLFNRPDIIRQVKVRPSLSRKVHARFNSLTASEKQKALGFIHGQNEIDQVSGVQSFDFLNLYFDYRRQKAKGDIKPTEQAKWNQVLQKRASLGAFQLPVLNIEPETRPDLGHDAYSASIFGGVESRYSNSKAKFDHGFFSIKLESAYHDLFNQDLGFKSFSEIQFPWIELRKKDSDSDIRIEELGALRIVALTPVTEIDFNYSWKFNLALESVKSEGCLDCRRGVWSSSVGLAKNIFSEFSIAYALVGFQAEFAKDIPQEYRLMPSLEIGMIGSPFEKYKLGLMGFYTREIKAQRLYEDSKKISLNQAYSLSRNQEVRQSVNWSFQDLIENPKHSEIRLDYVHYFR